MNQIRSVNFMIEYILEYQNSYVFLNLFTDVLIEMIDKHVHLSALLGSKIFNYTFDFDTWAGTNTDTTKLIKPYNKSIFDLRNQYSILFEKIWRADEDKETVKLA